MIRKALSTLKNFFTFSLVKLVKRFQINNEIVIHVGANFGQEADTYDQLGFKKVVWIEGYPPFFEELQNVIRKRANHQSVEALLTDSTGEKICFNITSNSGSSSALILTDKWKTLHPNISVTQTTSIFGKRFSDLFENELKEYKNKKISLMVLDIEGSELIALKGLDDIIYNIEFALIEFSTDANFVGGPLISDIDAFMMSKNFKRVWHKLGVVSGDALYKSVKRVSPVTRLTSIISGYYLILFTKCGLTRIAKNAKNIAKRFE